MQHANGEPIYAYFKKKRKTEQKKSKKIDAFLSRTSLIDYSYLLAPSVSSFFQVLKKTKGLVLYPINASAVLFFFSCIKSAD